MIRLCRLPPLLLSVILLALPAAAQTKRPAPPAKEDVPASNAARKDRSEAKAEADRFAAHQREQARSLLLSLASDARSFRDQTLRARTLARIGDALWSSDPERGRELFRKAWEAAEIADRDTAQKRQEDIQRQRATSGGGYAIPSYPNMRSEVLRPAARRDLKLGEEFLEKLKADQQQDVNDENQRMSLANELLATGDPERALQFARSELATISPLTVDFLSWLREKNAAAADRHYASLLEIAARNVAADANTVSLLSSYLFTPHSYATFNGTASAYSVMGPGTPPTNIAPELRLVFFQTAASILLRTEVPPQQGEPNTGIQGKYLVMKRVLPFFEQHAPKELADAVRGRFEALGSMVRARVLGMNVDSTPVIPPSQTQGADREQAILDKIENAKTSAERDQLYFQLAMGVMEKDGLRAREFVSKIDESEFRKKAGAYIDATLANNSIHRKQIDLALELIQKGALTHIRRVWLQTQLAKLLVKTDRDKSLALLEDAVTEARRIEGLDPDRPRALLAIANAINLIEPLRTRDSVFEAVRAANSADGFTGEDGTLNILFQNERFSSASDIQVPDFDIKGIFGVLAKDDYDQAVELARGFQGEAPRAAAVIASALSVLNANKN